MKKFVAGPLLISIIFLVFNVGASTSPLVLWYEEPAEIWTEALPLGNGSLGAMVFGGAADDRIQFNEDTLWAGRPHDYSHPGASEYLPTLRTLLFQGEQKEAEALAMDHFMSIPLGQAPYQAFGELGLRFPGHENVASYRRELDLDTAIAQVRYKVGEVTYTREVFVSHPDQVIAIRIRADQPAAITCDLDLSTLHEEHEITVNADKGTVTLYGRVGTYETRQVEKRQGESVLRFAAKLTARIKGGRAEGGDGVLRVVGADEVCLYLAAATSYQGFEDTSGDPIGKCDGVIAGLAGQNFDEIRDRHVTEHRRLFRRVSLDLGSTAKAQLPTDQRIKSFEEGGDPQLAALYFQFGRYLLISSSRPGSQPANLQGLWNNSLTPPWDSKYTININTEMNYWAAEAGNLSECVGPLFDALDDLVISGRRTAKTYYDCRGWVLHHNFDLWRGAAPINNSNHGIWPVGGAWLCQHLWWRYQYSGDKEFLRERAYPVMKEAALFFTDYLMKDPRNDKGWLISGPSNSPEQGGLVMGPTMDHQIIRSLFGWVIEASEVLDVDDEFRGQLVTMRNQIAPNQIGQHGQLQEWLEDIDDPENKHRHHSHLWGLFPGEEISLRRTPKLAVAARKSLESRGDPTIGWGRAWQVSLFARLGDGDTAYTRLARLINRNSNPNLFDQCRQGRPEPFQIDANFGGTAGIVQMLLQSDKDEISLLPALPKAWANGSVSGLRARGGFEIDMTWKDGVLISGQIRSELGHACTLRYGNVVKTFPTGKGRVYSMRKVDGLL